MAFATTISEVHNVGAMRQVNGTFTSAEGDTSYTISKSDHGLAMITDYDIKLDTGGIAGQNPKVTVSGGTVTAVWDDTLGYSGKFSLTGR